MCATTLRLRPWQRAALDAFNAAGNSSERLDQSGPTVALDGVRRDFLAVATPGAGKTTFALTAARLALPTLPGRLVVVAPTRHLKEQWADAAQKFGLSLVTDWNPGDLLPADCHGVVTTYQQVGTGPDPFFGLSQGGFVILDEIHHAGEDRSWGEGVKAAFSGASRRLALSGTPFRSDTHSIPFVRYHLDEVVPDIEYGYGDALADKRVVRPVYFPRFGGSMEWTAPDGAQLVATFEDPLARTQANQRLRAALSLDGEWLPTVLGHAHRELLRIRERHTNAAGLVIAMDQDHARGIVRLLRDRFGVRAEIATSEDPKASSRISAFAGSDDPWIVAVRMISEGVDIPRLRVGVYATTTTTELFFRQAVGRIVRFTPGLATQRAYMFLPDDFRLRHYAFNIGDARRHSLKKDKRGEEQDDAGELDDLRGPRDEGDQMSLFTVHSATAETSDDLDDIFDDNTDAETDVSNDASLVDLDDSPGLTIDLTAVPLPGAPIAAAGFGGGGDRNERERLRRLNGDLASQLAELTGMPHRQINGELNRRSGVTKISEATIRQLNKRSRVAEQWLRQESRRRRFSMG